MRPRDQYLFAGRALCYSSMQTPSHVSATLQDGTIINADPSKLKFSLGQAVDEETFKARYAQQGVSAPRIVSLKDLAQMRLRAKIQHMQQARGQAK